MTSGLPLSGLDPRPSTSNHTNSEPVPKQVYQILAGQLFDPVNRILIPDQVVTLDRDTGIILDVKPQSQTHRKEECNGPNVEVTTIDLSHLTVLPGLVDVHVHLFLHPHASWEDQLMKESLAERTVRATVHARKTLQAGFTTVRDLGTEGAFDADIGLRKCLAGRNAVIPGPRYYCATRAIISSGAYGPKSALYPSQEGIDGIKGASTVDGVDDCIREVRKQIGAGADWIKIYADNRCRSRMSDVSTALSSQSIATFTKAELAAMISTAHSRGVKVAAHANTADAIFDLLGLSVDSIEHGSEMYDECMGDKKLLRKLAEANGTTTWVPTLAVYQILAKSGVTHAVKTWETCKATFQAALKMRLENIACGSDTGAFAHGQNALELVVMRQLGASWDRVLSWATYGGWKCVRGMEWDGERGIRRVQKLEEATYSGLVNSDLPAIDDGLEREVPFGVIQPGWVADLVGFEGKVDGSVEEFERAMMDGVRFVMKGGKIHRDGQEVLAV